MSIIIAESNDHLKYRGLLNCFIVGSYPDTEAKGEAIMTLLSAMQEAEKSVQRCFARELFNIIFVLSPGYASLPALSQFLYAMVTLRSEGRFDMVISAPNRGANQNLYYHFRSELPEVWSDISNAFQLFRGHSTGRMLLAKNAGIGLFQLWQIHKDKTGTKRCSGI